MKFIGAYESLTELSEKVELLKQESGKLDHQLVIFTKEEHEEDVKNLVDIEIEVVQDKTVDDEVSLEKYGLDKETAEIYNETIQLGGYVLLEKKS